VDYLRDLIQPRETELETNLGWRMDLDRRMYELEEFAMKQTDNETVMADVVNVTLNYPQTFADKVISVISGAVTQIVVEGTEMSELTKEKESAIEGCFEDIMELANERLTNLEMPDLLTYQAGQMALRGRAAQRNLVQQGKDGELEVDIMPCDTRYFTYGASGKRLVWGCNRYWRANQDIIEDYPEAEEKLAGKTSTHKSQIRDFWNDSANIVYLEEDILREAENPLGYPPFTYRMCNTGMFFNDIGSESHRGESIYSALRNNNGRGVYYELNRAMSILATVALYAAKPGYTREVEDISNTTAPGESQKPGVGKVKDIQRGMTYTMDKLPDINQAVQLYWNIIKSAYDQASLSMTEYGNTQFPLSAVALKSLSSKNDTIYLPRIQALSQLFQRGFYQIREQLSRVEGVIDISTEDREISYKTEDLSGKYRIGFKFYSVSPEEEVANTALASAYKAQGVDDETIYRDIYKFQNPGEKLARAREQRVKTRYPELEDLEAVYYAIEQGEDTKARMIFVLWKQGMRQKYLPQQQPIQPGMPTVWQPQGNGNKPGSELMPLLNKDGRRAKVPAEKLPAMPEVS